MVTIVDAMLKKLSEREAEVMREYYFTRHTFPQIAGIFGVTVAAIYQCHYRAVKKLGFRPDKPWQNQRRKDRVRRREGVYVKSNCFTADVSRWPEIG